jgi:hypothetical protein
MEPVSEQPKDATRAAWVTFLAYKYCFLPCVPFANAVLTCVAQDEKDHMRLTTYKSNQVVQALLVSATPFPCILL